MGTTRKAVRKLWPACRSCPENEGVPGSYGLCRAGYENFYCRANKKSACPKADASMTSMKRDQMALAMIKARQGNLR